MRRLLRSDPITRASSTFHEVPGDEGAFVIESAQDIEPTLVENRIIRNRFDERSDWKGDFHKIASIPNVILFDLKRRNILDDDKKFKNWLNDRDNRMFRTRPGRV